MDKDVYIWTLEKKIGKLEEALKNSEEYINMMRQLLNYHRDVIDDILVKKEIFEEFSAIASSQKRPTSVLYSSSLESVIDAARYIYSRLKICELMRENREEQVKK